MSGRWYVVSAQLGRETLAELHLNRQGFCVWMPLQTRSVRHARRIIERRVPFFPGYMFVWLDVDRQRWRSINGTIGVRSLIMEGERPLPCPKGLVESLQALAGEDGEFDGLSALRPNDPVRIVSGPFAELCGTLVRVDGADRARILLQVMRAEITVTLDRARLAPVSA